MISLQFKFFLIASKLILHILNNDALSSVLIVATL